MKDFYLSITVKSPPLAKTYCTVFNRPLLESSIVQTVSLVTAELDYIKFNLFSDRQERGTMTGELVG